MKKIFLLLTAILFFILLSSTVSATIRYVTPTGAGTLAGTSWVNAASDLQLTINNSSSGDEIWVAAGTYKPNRRADALGTITANDRNNAFVLKPGVKIYGGFAGSETLLSQRNWTTNTTILSGDLGAVGDTADNAYHVVISSVDAALPPDLETGASGLDGFTITGGNSAAWGTISVNGNTLQACFGGGIFCYSSSPALSNLILSNNYAQYGGGICNSTSASPTITGLTLTSNSAVYMGGGMLNTASSSPIMTNIIISNNTVTNGWASGGGVYNESGSNPIITNGLICKNNSAGNGGGMYSSDTSSPTLINVTVAYNTITGTSGQGAGAGICMAGTGTGAIKNSVIWGNTSDGTMRNVDGSVIYLYTLLEGGTVSSPNVVSNSDPLFVNSASDNYWLSASSPARDLGNNTYTSGVSTDLEGSNRIFGNTVDLGAYECQYPIVVSGANGIADGTGYYTLKAAFDAINAQTNQTGKNVIVRVAGPTTETATASLNNGNWTSLSIYPTASGLSITGAAGIQPILFNGADNVTIDGRLHDSSGTLMGSTIDMKLSVIESLDHISVTNSGSGYTSAPTVVITPTNGGAGATATAGVPGGAVTYITVTSPGSGYITPPTISFTGGGGSGATATAYVASKGTIAFDQNAQNNTVKYCRIEGAVQSDLNGTIAFLTGTAANGNGGNTISNNLITNNGVSRPQNSIISTGSTNYPNTGNIITNNEFKDFFATTDESRGIYIAGSGSSGSFGSTGWTITGNSFYETNALSPTTNSRLYGIKIGINDNSVGGKGFTISDNYFGGTAALCGGSAFTKTSSANNIFSAIALNLASGTPVSSIQNNTIKNMSWANSGGVTGNTDFSWSGIEMGRGNVNIGTVTGNKIGDNSTTGSIVVTGGNVGTNGSRTCGIQLQWQATADCENNTIGSITTANAEARYANHFYGIYNYSNNATTISNNIIGSASTANSINATSTSQDHDQHVYGIFCTNVSGSTPGAVTINGNTIANMTDGVTNTWAYINGIRSETSSTTITNNTVHDLTIANTNNAQSSSQASVSGIVFEKSSSSSVVTIDNNTVYSLSNTNSAFAGDINGIYYSAGSANNSCNNNTIYNISAINATGGANILGLSYNAGVGANIISSNFIYGLSVPNSTVGYIFGIKKNSGNVTFSNNIINLGGDYRSTIYGIFENGNVSNNSNLYFNTVYIGGSLGSGATNLSYCLYSNSSSNTRNFRNNIFSNVRSTTGGSYLHYSAWLNYGVSTSLTLDYNDYYVSGTGGVIGRYSGSNLTSLPLITGFDTNSKLLSPAFTNAGSTTATDYKIGVNLIGTSGTGITSDYAANVRSTEYTAMGAWERAMTNYWKGTNSSDWGTSANWTLSVLPPTDGNIEFDAAPLNNCVLNADVSVTDITNTQSTYKFVLNGHKATVKGNLALSNGAQLDASIAGSTIEFAGTAAQSIPSGAFYSNNVYNLTVNNTNNLSFNGQLNILNSLAATAGKLDAMTNSPTICYAGTSAQLIDSIPYLNGKAYNLTIDNAAGVSLSNDFVVDHLLTVNSGKFLTIPTAIKLNVLGTITNNAGASGLVIKSASNAANGTLIFHNTVDNPVLATVEMYSKAFYDSNGPVGSKYKWQYFGIPVRSLNADPTFYGSHLRQYNEPAPTSEGSWVTLNNSSILTSFNGYEMTQTSPKTIYFQGILENADMNYNLTHNADSWYKGQHIISNPYTAALDISKLNFTNMEAAIYLYNTGSHADWVTNSGITTPGISPGQYVAAPKMTSGSGGIPGQIPSMQGFQVNANSGGGNLNFPYSSFAVKNLTPQRVRKSATAEDKIFTIIDVQGSRYNDKMWLFTDPACTHSFDNGWDGFKILGSSLAPQICAIEADGNYQINAVDNIDNTDIGFKAGEDSNYTLTFNHQNMDLLYSALYLVDLLENKTIDISESGSTYTFTSNSASASDKRFKIVTNPNISTELEEESTKTCPDLNVYSSKQTIYIENNTAQKGDLTLYDSMGRIVDIIPFNAAKHTAMPTKLKSGVYVVKAFTAKKTVVVSLALP